MNSEHTLRMPLWACSTQTGWSIFFRRRLSSQQLAQLSDDPPPGFGIWVDLVGQRDDSRGLILEETIRITRPMFVSQSLGTLGWMHERLIYAILSIAWIKNSQNRKSAVVPFNWLVPYAVQAWKPIKLHCQRTWLVGGRWIGTARAAPICKQIRNSFLPRNRGFFDCLTVI